ncbi:MAG TPA: hypothetical protein PK529_09010, partial [Verrucomicrobiales bacterium]|nr:hypothetical protein [Verrucomicrobiales bacterium]
MTGLTRSSVAAFCGVVRFAHLMRSLPRRGRQTGGLVLIQSFSSSFCLAKNRGDWINALLRRRVLRCGSLCSLDAIAPATWQA